MIDDLLLPQFAENFDQALCCACGELSNHFVIDSPTALLLCTQMPQYVPQLLRVFGANRDGIEVRRCLLVWFSCIPVLQTQIRKVAMLETSRAHLLREIAALRELAMPSRPTSRAQAQTRKRTLMTSGLHWTISIPTQNSKLLRPTSTKRPHR